MSEVWGLCGTRLPNMVLVGSRPAAGRLPLDCRKANEFTALYHKYIFSKSRAVWSLAQ